jgi:hypothetical protein
MKIIKILEISWLIIAIAGIVMGAYKMSTTGWGDAIYFFIFTVVAGIFYFIRRKQRIKMEQQENEN